MNMANIGAAYDCLKVAQRELNNLLESDEQLSSKAGMNSVLANIIQAENFLLVLREQVVKQQMLGDQEERSTGGDNEVN
jgi:hypothetical protein